MDACLNMLCIASEHRGPLVSPALYSYYSVTVKKKTKKHTAVVTTCIIPQLFDCCSLGPFSFSSFVCGGV